MAERRAGGSSGVGGQMLAAGFAWAGAAMATKASVRKPFAQTIV
jgi:Asp-tRNA(Asn)/Glu-tRNA(Gln) amidotransferase A subunit family amidase